MSIVKERVEQVQEVIIGLVCDKCKKYVSAQDVIAYQECFHFNTTGGYGSVWGDGTDVSVTLCQHCVYDLLKDYAVVSENE